MIKAKNTINFDDSIMIFVCSSMLLDKLCNWLFHCQKSVGSSSRTNIEVYNSMCMPATQENSHNVLLVTFFSFFSFDLAAAARLRISSGQLRSLLRTATTRVDKKKAMLIGFQRRGGGGVKWGLGVSPVGIRNFCICNLGMTVFCSG